MLKINKNLLTDRALIVLNNYSRPDTMPEIIDAWKNQSVPNNHVVVVDNHSPLDSIEQYPGNGLSKADDVWRWKLNAGCPCHFYPALAYPQYAYIIFADDDLIPGRLAVEHLFDTARKLNNEFSTIGQIGRNFQMSAPEGQKYITRPQPTRDMSQPTKVHLTCRVHMTTNICLPYIFLFRNNIAYSNSDDGMRLSQVHDDFLMCMGIQRVTKYHSYLIPTGGIESDLIKKDLDDGKALWKKQGHFEDRNRMVELSLQAGWVPLF